MAKQFPIRESHVTAVDFAARTLPSGLKQKTWLRVIRRNLISIRPRSADACPQTEWRMLLLERAWLQHPWPSSLLYFETAQALHAMGRLDLRVWDQGHKFLEAMTTRTAKQKNRS